VRDALAEIRETRSFGQNFTRLVPKSLATLAAKGRNVGFSGYFHAACGKYEIDLDLVRTSKPGVLSPLAGERVVGHGRVGPRRYGDLVDA
jgi:hypothetical protein